MSNEVRGELDCVEHTPGPWHIGGSSIGAMLDCGERKEPVSIAVVRWNYTPSGVNVPADCERGGVSLIEAEANAKLIAASPRMLYVLEYVAWAMGGELPRELSAMVQDVIFEATGHAGRNFE